MFMPGIMPEKLKEESVQSLAQFEPMDAEKRNGKCAAPDQGIDPTPLNALLLLSRDSSNNVLDQPPVNTALPL